MDSLIEWMNKERNKEIAPVNTTWTLRGEEESLYRQLQKETNLCHSILQNADVLIIVWEISGIVRVFNRYAQEITGFSANEVVGKNWLDITIPERWKEEMQLFVEQAAAGSVRQNQENPIMCKNGEAINVLWRNSIVINPDEPPFVVSIGMNIDEGGKEEKPLQKSYEEISCLYETLMVSEEELRQQVNELQRNQEVLLKSEERYKIAIEGTNDGIWDWDMKKDIGYLSTKWSQMLGLESEQTQDHFALWCALFHPEDLEETLHCLHEHIEGVTQYYTAEYRLRRTDGEYVWVRSRGKAIRNASGQAIRMVGSHTDITEHKQWEKQIEYMAFYDTLTGLPNREWFARKLEAELERCKAEQEMSAVFFIDLDNFKTINDTYGHNIGDLLLQQVAKRLKILESKGISVCRLGGDEFIVFIPDIKNIIDIVQNANQILDAFRMPWTVNGQEVFATVSMGITVFPQDGQEVHTVLQNADLAMYKAKEFGKNNYQFYEPTMTQVMAERTDMEKSLRKAVMNQEFKLFYQPQVDIQTGRITGAEALIRWFHPLRGMISPQTFIPLAEETGLIVVIGKWALREACRQTKQWHDKGYEELHISVNISALQMQNEDFAREVSSILEETGLAPKYLELEITESWIIKNFDYHYRILNELREMGIRISLDDFGTGYSSLSYLKRLPIHNIKIDKSFIDDIYSDTTKQVITEAIINIAHKLKLDVTAEGVETQLQLQYLAEQNCDKIQGYYISRPVPVENLEEMLVEQYVQE